MREIHGQFSLVFRTRSGKKFNGELGNPTQDSSMDFRPRRVLTASNIAVVETGDVVTGQGARFLVSLSAQLSGTKQFKCFEITHDLLWSRVGEKIDFVTGLPRDAKQITLDAALPVVVEYGSTVDNKGFETEKYRILTGADVRVGDRIGEWIVQTRKEKVGLNLIEVA